MLRMNLCKCQDFLFETFLHSLSYAPLYCPGPEVIQLFFMLNSAEHDFSMVISIKYQEIPYISGSDKPRMLIYLLS